MFKFSYTLSMPLVLVATIVSEIELSSLLSNDI